MSEHIPDQILDGDVAVIARKGAGKSYLLRGLVERNLEAGRPTVILDPMEIWWGLKQKADGSPGFPIPVIGGGHADLPLDPARGPELARFLAEREASAVIDVSELKREQLLAFAAAFLEELFRLNRKPLWLVLEEADVFAPQNPASRATREMHDEVDRIVRRGRAFGFRVWTATQRPARLSKDVLTQTETLFLLQLVAPQDQGAADDRDREAGRAVGLLLQPPPDLHGIQDDRRPAGLEVPLHQPAQQVALAGALARDHGDVAVEDLVGDGGRAHGVHSQRPCIPRVGMIGS